MIARWKSPTRLLVMVALTAGLANVSTWAAALVPASAPASASVENKQDWAKQHQEWFKHVTDRMASRLEIKASQQNAWQAYTKTLETIIERPAKTPEFKTDAASVTRAHADMAAKHAQKLAQIADATAKLQEVLTPDQRKTLDQIVAHEGGHHHGHHFHGDEHGTHGERGEHGDGRWSHDQHDDKRGDGHEDHAN